MSAATPLEYANQGASIARPARIPLLKAWIAAFGFIMVLGVFPLLIVGWLVSRLDFMEHLTLIRVVMTVTRVAVECMAWCGFTVFAVAFLRMIARLRAGESMRAGDILEFDEFLVPAAILGAPIAVVQALSVGQLAWEPLDNVSRVLADLVLLALLWAPIEMALKGVGYQAAWTASVNFWKRDPIGHLIALVIITVRALIDGRVIFAPGIYTASLVAYYTDKTAAAGAAAAAPADAVAVR